MADQPMPNEGEFQSFMGHLKTFRETLPDGEQKLLDSMAYAALGQTEKPAEASGEDVAPYWVAYGATPYGGGYTVAGPYGGYSVGWQATPWGVAYGARVW